MDELYVMDAFLIRGLNEIRRAQVLKRLDLDIDISSPENVLAFYFGNEFAQKWWRTFIEAGEEMDEVLVHIDKLIRSTKADFTMNVFQSLGTPENSDAR